MRLSKRGRVDREREEERERERPRERGKFDMVPPFDGAVRGGMYVTRVEEAPRSLM